MKRAMAAWALLLCLSLSACGTSEGANAPSPLGQAAGLDENAALLTVDGREIPAWQYLYWLAEDCALLEERCEEAEEPLDWTKPSMAGTTLEALVKETALSDTALCAVIDAWAEAYHCNVTEADTPAAAATAYLTEEQGRILSAWGQQYSKLYQLYQTPGSPLSPTEGELALFERESGLLAAERLLIPFNGERAAAQQQAERLFAQINGAEDAEAAFTALLAEYGGVMTAADWTPSLLDAAAALAVGQRSGIIETDMGFVLLRRLPTDQAALRETHFDSLLQGAADSSVIKVSAEYEALRPGEFYTALSSFTP